MVKVRIRPIGISSGITTKVKERIAKVENPNMVTTNELQQLRIPKLMVQTNPPIEGMAETPRSSRRESRPERPRILGLRGLVLLVPTWEFFWWLSRFWPMLKMPLRRC